MTTEPTNTPSAETKPKRKNPQVTRLGLVKLLQNVQLSPSEIREQLKLAPCLALKMLRGAALRRELEIVLNITRKRQLVQMRHAPGKALELLAKLAEGTGETARKACLDLLAIAEAHGLAPDDGETDAAAPMTPLETRIDDVLRKLRTGDDGRPPADTDAQDADTPREATAADAAPAPRVCP